VLRPIFLDEEELAAGSLSGRLYSALEASDALIVVASPAAANSDWVAQEVRWYAEHKPQAHILPIIAAGTPNAALGIEECFPPALRRKSIALGDHDNSNEAYGPDVRIFGEEGAFLRIAAGLLGVGVGLLLDRHREREAAEKRKLQRLTGITFVEPACRALQSGMADLALRYVVCGAILADDPNFEIVPELAAPGAAAGFETKLYAALNHDAGVEDVDVSADGKWILTACSDNKARIWDSRSGKEVLCLYGHSKKVELARFDAAARRVLTTSYDTTAVVWDAVNGEQLGVLDRHRLPITAAAFSVDGTLVATGSFDKLANLWWPDVGRVLALAHDRAICSVALGPDASVLVTATEDGSLSFWYTETGQELRTLSAHHGSITKLVFSPDGGRLGVASEDYTASVWNVADGRCICRLKGHKAPICDINFSPAGDQIVSASSDNTARVWDAASGKIVSQFTGHSAPVLRAVFLPDSKKVVSAAFDETVQVWDATTSTRQAFMISRAGQLNSLVQFKDGSRVVAASNRDTTARVWALGGVPEIARTTGRSLGSPVLSPDGTRCVYISTGKPILWDVCTGSVIAELGGSTESAKRMAFSPDGGLIGIGYQDMACVFDGNTGALMAKLVGHTGQINSIAWHPGGRYLLSASDDTTARIWEVASGQERVRLVGHAEKVNKAVFDAAGRLVLTGSNDNTGCVWDALTARRLVCFAGHGVGSVEIWDFKEDGPRLLPGWILDVAFSSDGVRALTVGSDSTARIWDRCTGKELVRLSGNDSSINRGQFSIDGKYVVTTGLDAARFEPVDPILWEAETGFEVGRLVDHGGAYTATFSRNGSFILTTSKDGIVRLWDANSGAQIARLAGCAAALSSDGCQLAVVIDGTILSILNVTNILAFAEPLRVAGMVARLDRGVGSIRSKGERLLNEAPEDLYATFLDHFGTSPFIEKLARARAILERPKINRREAR
jgi:WD40 repeat protein